MAAVAAQDELVGRVQELAERVEALGDPDARALAEDLAAAVVELYGEGLGRIFAALAQDDATAAEVRAQLIEDGVVASLMLIHGIYPVALETRVLEALDEVRPYMESHGGDVELVSLDDGVARLRLTGSCHGCPESSHMLELALERALEDAAPDLLGLEVQGAVPPRPARDAVDAEGRPVWVTLDGDISQLARGVLTAVEGLVVANVAGTLLAYRDACAACGASLDHGALVGGTLRCAECGAEFDLPRAGRARDDPAVHLEPVPLLRSNGSVRVALRR